MSRAMVGTTTAAPAAINPSNRRGTSTVHPPRRLTPPPRAEPPTLTINGDNPATITVGDSYPDLGAPSSARRTPSSGEVAATLSDDLFAAIDADNSNPNVSSRNIHEHATITRELRTGAWSVMVGAIDVDLDHSVAHPLCKVNGICVHPLLVHIPATSREARREEK